MKTDELFYELFRVDPRSLFELVQLRLEGEYVFESITVKTTRKRFDGFFKRKDGEGPNGFLEVQGYMDKTIYWRSFRETCTWYEQSGSKTPFVMIILFLDEKYDPGDCMLDCVPPCQLIRCNLADCLDFIGEQAGALSVLKPLTLSEEKELPEVVPKWKTNIRSLQLSEQKIETLIDLLIYAILQRFPKMGREEIDKMLELTPLEETTAVKEIIQITREEGREEGIDTGELIGKIHMAQRLLGKPITPREKFIDQGV
ncbi:MAG: DUF2887 domain-containing protein, partial [Proteobacteria bacterium]|nr:DUF2887 domain-containing protein [Pseudomonadota bacterium]